MPFTRAGYRAKWRSFCAGYRDLCWYKGSTAGVRYPFGWRTRYTVAFWRRALFRRDYKIG